MDINKKYLNANTTEWFANIAALRNINFKLANRIENTSFGEHIKIENNNIYLLKNQNWFNLYTNKKETITKKKIGIFGLGSPSFIDHIIQSTAEEIVLWDRDPSILKLLLSSRDYSSDILVGRIKIALGADLLLYLKDFEWHFHPTLSQFYNWELALIKNEPSKKRAILTTGGLFIDDLWDALNKEGFIIFPFAIDIHSLDELRYTVEKFQPDIAFMINYVHGTAEFFKELNIPLRCWEIDPATDYIKNSTQSGDAIIFSYRKKNIPKWQEKGYKSEYLPLASNISRRKPNDTDRLGVSFVGASMALTSRNYVTHLQSIAEKLLGEPEFAKERVRTLIEEQLENYDYNADKKFRDLFPHWPESEIDPTMLLGEIIASSYRFRIIERLAKFDIELWGDEGWTNLTKIGVHYRGPAGHFNKLNDIYRKSMINIDIGRIYQADIVTMRVFDILACRGFVLAAHSDALAELFDIGSEVDSWRTAEELEEKVAWYLKNPDTAISIAKRGHERVLKDHTIQIRLRKMLEPK